MKVIEILLMYVATARYKEAYCDGCSVIPAIECTNAGHVTPSANHIALFSWC